MLGYLGKTCVDQSVSLSGSSSVSGHDRGDQQPPRVYDVGLVPSHFRISLTWAVEGMVNWKKSKGD